MAFFSLFDEHQIVQRNITCLRISFTFSAISHNTGKFQCIPFVWRNALFTGNLFVYITVHYSFRGTHTSAHKLYILMRFCTLLWEWQIFQQIIKVAQFLNIAHRQRLSYRNKEISVLPLLCEGTKRKCADVY